MKYYTFIGYLKRYERLNNSVYGNPRYKAFFENDKEYLYCKTKSDASCAYNFLNYIERPRKVKYHVTKNNNVIVDDIEIL